MRGNVEADALPAPKASAGRGKVTNHAAFLEDFIEHGLNASEMVDQTIEIRNAEGKLYQFNISDTQPLGRRDSWPTALEASFRLLLESDLGSARQAIVELTAADPLGYLRRAAAQAWLSTWDRKVDPPLDAAQAFASLDWRPQPDLLLTPTEWVAHHWRYERFDGRPRADELTSAVRLPAETSKQVLRLLEEFGTAVLVGRGASGKTVMSLALAARHDGTARYLDLKGTDYRPAIIAVQDHCDQLLSCPPERPHLLVIDNLHTWPVVELEGLVARLEHTQATLAEQEQGPLWLLYATRNPGAETLARWPGPLQQAARVEHQAGVEDFQNVMERLSGAAAGPPMGDFDPASFGHDLVLFARAVIARRRQGGLPRREDAVEGTRTLLERWLLDHPEARSRLRLALLAMATELELVASAHLVDALPDELRRLEAGWLFAVEGHVGATRGWFLEHASLGTLLLEVLEGVAPDLERRNLAAAWLKGDPSSVGFLLRALARMEPGPSRGAYVAGIRAFLAEPPVRSADARVALHAVAVARRHALALQLDDGTGEDYAERLTDWLLSSEDGSAPHPVEASAVDVDFLNLTLARPHLAEAFRSAFDPHRFGLEECAAGRVDVLRVSLDATARLASESDLLVVAATWIAAIRDHFDAFSRVTPGNVVALHRALAPWVRSPDESLLGVLVRQPTLLVPWLSGHPQEVRAWVDACMAHRAGGLSPDRVVETLASLFETLAASTAKGSDPLSVVHLVGLMKACRHPKLGGSGRGRTPRLLAAEERLARVVLDGVDPAALGAGDVHALGFVHAMHEGLRGDVARLSRRVLDRGLPEALWQALAWANLARRCDPALGMPATTTLLQRPGVFASLSVHDVDAHLNQLSLPLHHATHPLADDAYRAAILGLARSLIQRAACGDMPIFGGKLRHWVAAADALCWSSANEDRAMISAWLRHLEPSSLCGAPDYSAARVLASASLRGLSAQIPRAVTDGVSRHARRPGLDALSGTGGGRVPISNRLKLLGACALHTCTAEPVRTSGWPTADALAGWEAWMDAEDAISSLSVALGVASLDVRDPLRRELQRRYGRRLADRCDPARLRVPHDAVETPPRTVVRLISWARQQLL